MSEELYFYLVYQLNLVNKLLSLEQDPIKRAKYEGIQYIIIDILERNILYE